MVCLCVQQIDFSRAGTKQVKNKKELPGKKMRPGPGRLGLDPSTPGAPGRLGLDPSTPGAPGRLGLDPSMPRSNPAPGGTRDTVILPDSLKYIPQRLPQIKGCLALMT